MMNYHTRGGLDLDGANLRQAARKFNLIFVAYTDDIALREFPFC